MQATQLNKYQKIMIKLTIKDGRDLHLDYNTKKTPAANRPNSLRDHPEGPNKTITS